MPSAAACYLVSHQQTHQFSNKLNFISVQLIITFPQECLGLDDMALRKNSHTAATVWYPMNSMMCYQPCIWLLSRNFCWWISDELFGEYSCLQNARHVAERKMAAFKSSAQLFLKCLCLFHFYASLHYRRCPTPAMSQHAVVAMKTHCLLMYLMYQPLIMKEQCVHWVSDWPF